MIAPIIRIVFRWLVIPTLVYLGLPQETIDQILGDEDVRMVLTVIAPIAVAAIEAWWLWALRKAGKL